jgi:glycosyltransferase involved in cell wall biosynthesis
MDDFDSKTELVSIIIPTFRRRNVTSRAIKSCLSQTYENLEVIVINDELGDSEFTELNNSFANESRVVFYTMSHSGHPGKVRNFGIHHSKGEWIAFLDSDDYWGPNKLKLQLEKHFESHASAICSNAFIEGTQNLLLDRKIPAEINLNQLLTRNLVINSSVLIKRKLLTEIGGVVESASTLGAEDYATWLRVSTKTSCAYMSDGLVHYEAKSADSVKFSSEVSQIFSKTQGILNFIEWRRLHGGKLRASRLLLHLLPKILQFELTLSPAKPIHKESNP